MNDHTATETPQAAPAVGAQVDRGVRPLAGMRKGMRVRGDKHMPEGRMTMHWVHTPHNRMHWCNCMPGFRVGGKIFHPRDVKGNGVPTRPRLRSFIDDLVAHDVAA